MDTFGLIAGLIVLGMMWYAIIIAWYDEIQEWRAIAKKNKKNKKRKEMKQ